MMRAGTRSCPVDIYRKSTTQNDYGEVLGWEKVRSAWASILPMRGTEDFRANERFSTVTHRFRFDFYDARDVTEKMRLDYEGRQFDIVAILRDEVTKGDIVIMAEEKSRGA